MALQYCDMTGELFEVVRREGPGDGGGGTSDVVLRLSVQPGAGRSGVVGRHGDALRVRVAPPPADGRANAAVLGLCSDILGVGTARLELVAGERSRQKRVRVHDVDPAEVSRRLDEAIGQARRHHPGQARAGGAGG